MSNLYAGFRTVRLAIKYRFNIELLEKSILSFTFFLHIYIYHIGKMSMSSELAAGIEDSDLHFDRKSPMDIAKSSLSNLSIKKKEEITLFQRMISACLGSLVTSLVVTPFDVVRIRIQQQEILPIDKPCCQTHFPEHSLKRPTTSPELFWLSQNYCKTADNCSRITSTFQGFQTIKKHEGLFTLWRGLSLTLLMTIPSNIIYFTGYEYIRDNSPMRSHVLNPLFCGSCARIMAATFVAPIELIKTRLQSIPFDGTRNNSMLSSLFKDLYSILKQKGVGTLFKGLQITLWRDVPFSGIYWSCYELFKEKISLVLEADFNEGTKGSATEDWKVFVTSFLSGSISGTIGALCTHPFDVGKTRLQITSEQDLKGEVSRKPSMFKFLTTIYKEEGTRALYSGIGPRILKIAPSCAIMISSYEIGKKFFKKGNTV